MFTWIQEETEQIWGRKIKWKLLSTKTAPQHQESFVVLDVVRVPWKNITQFFVFYSGEILLWPLLKRQFKAGWSDFFDHFYVFSCNYTHCRTNFNTIGSRNIISQAVLNITFEAVLNTTFETALCCKACCTTVSESMMCYKYIWALFFKSLWSRIPVCTALYPMLSR